MDGWWKATPLSSVEQESLEVKPLRSLSPMLPASLGLSSFSPQAASPFICVTPYGTFSPGFESGFPDGFSSFYPSSFVREPTGNKLDDSTDKNNRRSRAYAKKANGPMHENNFKFEQPVPLRSVPMSSSPEEERTNGQWSKKKRYKRAFDKDSVMPQGSASDSRESVEVVLITFDALRRRLLQLDVVKEANHRAIGKAGTIMIENDLRANKIKRIGPVPGVEVGDIFYCRIEMCLVGLHAHPVSGIDYTVAKFDDNDDPVAICVVSAGVYDNDENRVDSLIYTGQGSTDKDDQKLERGNLAMDRSLRRGNEIRVVRTAKDISNGKVYVYDGLYQIVKSWVEKVKSGFNVFRYQMVRNPDQPEGLAMWKRTEMWKQDPTSRQHVILRDMTFGVESIPVCLVNDVDDEKGPSHFTYITEPKYDRNKSSMKHLIGCACSSSSCTQADNCPCVQRNGGVVPYCLNGLLVSHKRMIYECGSSCQCPSKCKTRSTQKHITLHFEVFKTVNRGWALRSLDAIRAGTFICEYTGEVIDQISHEDDCDEEEDAYIFRATCTDDKAFKWNYVPELLGEPTSSDPAEHVDPVSVTISAKKMGNVSRFMNHSCSPNVFWQAVQRDDEHPHIMFVAIRHIPPMTELTYDYGSTGAVFGYQSVKKCYCGSLKCRGVIG